MPVIDETIFTQEIKKFKEEVRAILLAFEKRVVALEERAAKGK